MSKNEGFGLVEIAQRISFLTGESIEDVLSLAIKMSKYSTSSVRDLLAQRLSLLMKSNKENTMNAQEFKKKFLEIIERDFASFEANKILDDSNTFCDWVDVFLAWMEFASLEECQECYDDGGD